MHQIKPSGCLSRLKLVLLSSIACLLMTPSAFAQIISCDGFPVEQLQFSGAVLSSGTDLQPGAIYDFANVTAGINAQIEILGTFNGSSLSAIDNDGGITAYLQPQFVPNPAGGSFASFRVSFLNAATGQPQALNFAATQIDVDGDSQNLREFVEFDTSLSQFTVDETTELLINASGPSSSNFTRFESTTSNTAPGIDPSAFENIVRAFYTNVTQYEFVYGTLGPGATTRLASVGFDCPSIPNPVNTIPTPEADLVTVKTLAASASATPAIGDNVTYEITVTNNGPDSATNITLTDDLPAGLTATPNNGTASDGTYTGGIWSLPILQIGDSATLTLEGTVDIDQGGAAITNTLSAAAVSNADDPSSVGDDLSESITVQSPTLDAIDNDFTSAPFSPDVAGVSPSVFDNDTINGAVFPPSAVSVTIEDDGSLFGATINPDGTINIPAGTAPGIYELVYEICNVHEPDNCASASALITVRAPAINVHVNPDACGDYLSQGWITHGKFGLHDSEVLFGSADFATDPYLYLPIERDTQGRILTYFGTPSGSATGTISTPAATNLVATSNNDADHQSEMHVIVYRLDGVPGASVSADIDTRAAQEYTAYWIEDSAGDVIGSNDFEFTTGTAGIGGIGEVLSVSFTAPADGIAYLNTVIFDPSAFYGRPVIENYECPAPSLSMTKLADSQGPHTEGDTITYTYTVTNDGNVNVNDIAISDTHNGSGPAPTPANETLLTDAAPLGDSTDAAADGSWDVLAPGDTLTFTGTYTVSATDAENL